MLFFVLLYISPSRGKGGGAQKLQSPGSRHSRADVLPFIYMIIRLVACGDAFLHQLPHTFSVNVWNSGGAVLHGGLLKDPAHVVEKPGGRQHDRGRLQIVLPIQEILGVLVALDRRMDNSNGSETNEKMYMAFCVIVFMFKLCYIMLGVREYGRSYFYCIRRKL